MDRSRTSLAHQTLVSIAQGVAWRRARTHVGLAGLHQCQLEAVVGAAGAAAGQGGDGGLRGVAGGQRRGVAPVCVGGGGEEGRDKEGGGQGMRSGRRDAAGDVVTSWGPLHMRSELVTGRASCPSSQPRCFAGASLNPSQYPKQLEHNLQHHTHSLALGEVAAGVLGRAAGAVGGQQAAGRQAGQQGAHVRVRRHLGGGRIGQ